MVPGSLPFVAGAEVERKCRFFPRTKDIEMESDAGADDVRVAKLFVGNRLIILSAILHLAYRALDVGKN